MAYSSENSCKNDCSCDSCKSSHKNTQSEGFKQKAAYLINKTKTASNKLKDAITLGLGDTHGQEWTSTSNLSGAFPGAGTAAAAAYNIGRRAVDAFRESSEYIGSQEHYNDLVERNKRDIDNFKKERDPYARQYLQHIAQKSLQNVQNHPLHSKQPIKEDLNAPTSLPSHYVTHVFSFGEGQEAEHVGTWNGDKFTANDPNHPVYGDNGSYRKNNRRAPPATTMRDPHQGPPNEVHVVEKPNKELDKNDKHSVNHWHEHHTSMATMYDSLAKTTGTAKEKYEWRKKAAHHQDEAMKVRPEFYTNPVTGKPNEPHHVKDFEKWSPKPKETSDEKKAEDMLKESKEDLKMTKTLPRGVVKKGPGETYGDVDKCAPPTKDKDKKDTVVSGETGEEYSNKSQTEVKKMSEDKYSKLAELAFGHLNQNNQFRSAPIDEEILNESGDTQKGRDRLKALAQRTLEGTVKKVKTAPGYPYDKKTIQSRAVERGQETLRRIMRRIDDRGFKPREESINQRFPDVERDIAAIMKESYKKNKMMEDATNIHITTPEQRGDWLNVGRGSMNVLDYINKYKV